MKTKTEILNILSEVPDLDVNGTLSYRYLALGITNENYWVRLNNVQYVLRINNPESGRLGLSRENELSIMSAVKSLNISPENIFLGKTNDFYLSKWIPGRTWDKAELEKPINLNRFAQRLKQLHELPYSTLSQQKLPQLDLLKRFEHYRMMIQQRHGSLPTIEQRLLPVVFKLLSSIKNSLPKCLCHNDLLTANILTSELHANKDIYFLDWEYAAINDPLFELAVICRGNKLSSEHQQYFLQAYFGDNSGDYNNELEIWCWFYEYLSLLWGLVILPADIPLPENLNQLFQQLVDTIPRH